MALGLEEEEEEEEEKDGEADEADDEEEEDDVAPVADKERLTCLDVDGEVILLLSLLRRLGVAAVSRLTLMVNVSAWACAAAAADLTGSAGS